MKQLLVIILCALCIFSIAFADTMLNPFTGKIDFVGAVAVNWDDLEDVINDAAINWTAVKEIGDDNINWTDFNVPTAAINWDAEDFVTDASINWTDIPNITIAGTLTAGSIVSNATGQSVVTEGLVVNNDGGGTETHDFVVNTETVTSAIEVDAGDDVLYVNVPIKVNERAAADVDLAGYGQIWVKSDAPNTLWFTDDDGTDTQLGAAASVNWIDTIDLTTDGAVVWGNIEEGELADSTVVSADIKNGTIAGGDLASNIAITSTGVQDYGGATSFEIPNSADPDVDALGEVSYDSDDFSIRAFDGTSQFVAGKKTHQISKTMYKPAKMDNNGHIVLWKNLSAFIYKISRIWADSETDDVDFSLIAIGGSADGLNWDDVVEIEPFTIDTDSLEAGGVNWFSGDILAAEGINWTEIGPEDAIGVNWTDLDEPDWVHLEIEGWFNADVN
jgi:hypothetical protein